MRLLTLALGCLLAPSAHAGVALAFDGARCYSGTYEYWLTGTGMAGPHSQLLAAGHSVLTTSLLTPQALAGTDLFVSGLPQYGTTLAASEMDALTQWISAGGSALLFGEHPGYMPISEQFALICGVTYAGAVSSTTVTFIAPTHPVVQGSAGTVVTVGPIPAPGSWSNVPATATTIAENPNGSAAIVAALVGQGRVLLLNDTAYFSYPPSYVADNPILWDNAIEWLMGASGTGTAFCSGDGTSAACPCGNQGGGGEGCAHSFGVGAELTGTGQASVGADMVVLQGSQMPNSSALYFQGTQRLNGGLGVTFGDGLRCVGGNITRLGTKQNVGGASSYPTAGDLPVSVRGNVAAGDVRQYQIWYRNSAAFCTPSGFNLSNGYEIAWGV
jgi:hypothetical protein